MSALASIVGCAVAWGILGFHTAASIVCGLLERFGATEPEPLHEAYRKQWGDPR